MTTVTNRNVPAETVTALKSLARSNKRSLQQEVREILHSFIVEHHSVLDQIPHSGAGIPPGARRPERSTVCVAAERACVARALGQVIKDS